MTKFYAKILQIFPFIKYTHINTHIYIQTQAFCKSKFHFTLIKLLKRRDIFVILNKLCFFNSVHNIYAGFELLKQNRFAKIYGHSVDIAIDIKKSI